jgi:hypothetical protein
MLLSSESTASIASGLVSDFDPKQTLAALLKTVDSGMALRGLVEGEIRSY